jgi:hypothetical protein
MKQLNNITVNDSTLRSLQQLAERRGSTLDEISSEMLERGVKDACYRMKHNQQKWSETKAMKQRLQELERMVGGE